MPHDDSPYPGRQAHEAYMSEQKVLEDHIVANPSDKELHQKVHDALTRARTTKCECLLLKVFNNAKKKNIQQQQHSIKEHLQQHARDTRVEADSWIFSPVLKEAPRLLACK